MEVYDDDDYPPDTDDAADEYYQEYIECATGFSEELAASSDGSGWFYADPVDASRERADD